VSVSAVKRSTRRCVFLWSVLGALSLFGSKASGNDAGRMLFEPCRACHALAPGAGAMAGPNLAGLLGRYVAGDRVFDYSPVLRQAGAENQIWTEERLDRFLTDPEAMFPGMWMTARRMDDAGERQALIRFLADPASR
jgi:cytochrome c